MPEAPVCVGYTGGMAGRPGLKATFHSTTFSAETGLCHGCGYEPQGQCTEEKEVGFYKSW